MEQMMQALMVAVGHRKAGNWQKAVVYSMAGYDQMKNMVQKDCNIEIYYQNDENKDVAKVEVGVDEEVIPRKVKPMIY